MEGVKVYPYSGMVELTEADICFGSIYEAPCTCDVCGVAGVPVLEFDFFSRDTGICAECLRGLADLVDSWAEAAPPDADAST